MDKSRKKGRRTKTSRTASVGMSVVTNRLCHLRVTKSRSASGEEKVCCWDCPGLSASDVSDGEW
jgi:hypothetical protein